MSALLRYDKGLKLLVLVTLMALAQVAAGQVSATLLRLQRSRASLDVQSSAPHARGMYGITYGNPGDVWSYPNSESCLLVYNDGRYVLEKRDEQTVGRPRVKSAEGALAADDLQQLRAILDNDELKKITDIKALELPADTQALRDAERLDVQIDRAGAMQRFTTLKERVKTGAASTTTSGLSTGLDTFLDNGGPYKKTLGPLMKWFEGLEKKSKSALKESKPQYCMPMNLG